MKTHTPPARLWEAEENKPQIIVCRGSKPYKAKLHKSVREGQTPVLCTNVLGTIVYEKGTFFSHFSSHIEVDDHTYEVSFAEPADVDTDGPWEEVSTDDAIYEQGGQYYLKIPGNAGEEEKYYLLEKAI